MNILAGEARPVRLRPHADRRGALGTTPGQHHSHTSQPGRCSPTTELTVNSRNTS